MGEEHVFIAMWTTDFGQEWETAASHYMDSLVKHVETVLEGENLQTIGLEKYDTSRNVIKRWTGRKRDGVYAEIKKVELLK